MARHSQATPDRASIGRPAPWAARFVRGVVAPVVRLAFRPTMEGLERLPDDGPFLLVANHSAGMGIAEIASFAAIYLERIGRGRPLAGFAHPVAFRVPGLRLILEALGAVPSTYEAAEEALAAGVPLLVFPGGDHETLRPVWQAGRVDFAGRRGFLRIAKRAGVPVVPMGIAGAHYTAPMLWRSPLLARLLVVPTMFGFKRWGISLLGALGAGALLAMPWPLPARVGLSWAWLWCPFSFLPIVPWTIRFRVGEPIPPADLFDGEDDQLTLALERVQSAVQALVDG